MITVMKHPAFFGYGSLVNRATHAHAPATPASLKGWRRVWQPTALRALAFLSVEPCPDTTIDGLIAAVPDNDWAALDLRESAYTRTPLAPKSLTPLAPWASTVQIYRVSAPPPAAAQPHPILLSYLDCVAQGFAREFGPEGLNRFFTTTSGWHSPILDDRKSPRYPRHQPLSLDETSLIDHHLTRLRSPRIST